jgi:hypothetical protein
MFLWGLAGGGVGLALWPPKSEVVPTCKCRRMLRGDMSAVGYALALCLPHTEFMRLGPVSTHVELVPNRKTWLDEMADVGRGHVFCEGLVGVLSALYPSVCVGSWSCL